MPLTRLRVALRRFALVASIAATDVDASIDTLIQSGRVIDPETALDAVCDIGIDDGRIVRIEARIDPNDVDEAGTIIDASGRVVAPGFIDLHVHGQSDAAHEYQAHDGVTTALELEWGYPEVAKFLASRQGKSRVHYGASVSHGHLRALALAQSDEALAALRDRMAQAVQADEPLLALSDLVAESFSAPLDAAQQQRVAAEIRRGLTQGGLGVGMSHAYYPGADRPEILAVFETAARLGVPIFTHVRGRGLEAAQEVVANAAATGASLHIVHVNSISQGEIGPVLALIRGAQQRGIDVTTEVYPYTAGSTSITATFFDTGDWQTQMGITYRDLQWQDTGERLTAESFARYRKQGGIVIIHSMKESWIEEALGNNWVIVASDGMPYAPGAHPRSAGTFTRVLGRYVRERGLIDLPTAIRKMTLLPAERLEAIAPQMSRKGRVQIGADADLVVFDPDTVTDTATFESGPRFSQGIDYVLVAGVAVVAEGESVPDVFPGQAIVSHIGRLTGAAPE